MAATAIPAVLKQPGSDELLPPQPALALAVTLVVLSTGCLFSLHLLAAWNLLFGYPVITSRMVILAASIGVSAAALIVRRMALYEKSDRCRARQTRLSPKVRMVAAWVGIWYAIFAVSVFGSFPDGYDPLSYHIDLALKWLQYGTLRSNIAWGWHYSLPANAELPALIAVSAGMPNGIVAGNLLAAILFAISVYLIALKMTGDSESSLLAACVVTTIPMVICQAFRLYVDLFGTAFLISAVALLVWRHSIPRTWFFLSGCAVGIAIGTKPVFWVYAVMFAITAVTITFRTEKTRLKCVALLTAGLLMCSGLWFLRSALATGNPFYPMRLAIGGLEVFHGYARTVITPTHFGVSSLRELATQPWSESLMPSEHGEGLPVGGDRGTGPLFAAIVLPGLLFLLVRTARRQVSPLERNLLLAAILGFVLWDLALLRVPRFALPPMALSCALAAPMLQSVLAKQKRLTMALCLAGVCLNGLYCLAEPLQRTFYRIRLHDFSRATYYGYPPIIDHLPPTTRILDFTEGHRSSFILAGASLANHVLPAGNPDTVDYVARDGPRNAIDAGILSAGSVLVYDATPRSLYPKTTQPWRIYRVH